MKRLWVIDVSREQYLTAYVEGDTAEEARRLLRERFQVEHFGPDQRVEYGPARPVTSRPAEDEMLVYGEGDRTPAEWWDRYEEYLAERARTPGTPEYYEAVEFAGQQRLPEVAP